MNLDEWTNCHEGVDYETPPRMTDAQVGALLMRFPCGAALHRTGEGMWQVRLPTAEGVCLVTTDRPEAAILAAIRHELVRAEGSGNLNVSPTREGRDG